MNTLTKNNTLSGFSRVVLKEFKKELEFDIEEKRVTPDQIKKAAKYLVRLHEEGKVSEDDFNRFMKALIFSFMVNDMENKIEKKASRKSILTKRFLNYHSTWSYRYG